jgi:hypothetical protein
MCKREKSVGLLVESHRHASRKYRRAASAILDTSESLLGIFPLNLNYDSGAIFGTNAGTHSREVSAAEKAGRRGALLSSSQALSRLAVSTA